MKRKLFLFITCFFVFSSLIIFLTHRSIQLSKITKNKEEEVKRLLKELKEQKEKNIANQEEEKKNENKADQEDNQKNNQEEEKNKNKVDQEETDDLPWLFTWIGAIIDLIISTVVIHIAINCSQNLKGKMEEKENGKMYAILCLIIILLCIVVFPPIFAIKKYKNKSYWERLKLIEKNFSVFIIFITIFAIMIASLVTCERPKNCKKDK